MDGPSAARSAFARELELRNPPPDGRRWVYVPYDQLTDAIGPLSREAPAELGVVLVESRAKARRRPYHRQKLALILANQRHFALEQAARGVAVEYVATDAGYADALEPIAERRGGLRCMVPAERELRRELEPLVERGLLELVPHEGWLTTPEQFRRSVSRRGTARMDEFYRIARRESGLLMTPDGEPLGGKFSFDAENRHPWRGEPATPELPRFEVDAITAEVGELVAREFADHPGELDLESLPANRADAEALWRWALDACLPHFGPYEDAMSARERTLFHTRVSSVLHLHRLLPARVLADVSALDVELRCREGFVRQVLGWREFVHHVHDATDGLRTRFDGAPLGRGDGAPSELGAAAALPLAFWGTPSGLACLDEVVRSVWDEGYSHHITRLMVLSNLATLLDVDPRELTDWFWVAYTDAYDWVVEPNVLAMGTFATGELMTTKPYVCGSAYIARMSDYCSSCAFDPRRDCPVASLYWAFLERHRDRLESIPRLRLPLASSAKREARKQRTDERVFTHVSERLARGDALSPAGLREVQRAAAEPGARRESA